MNSKLEFFLKTIFELKDEEFNISLSKDEISNWDSLKQMDLVTGLEKEFSIELEMMEIVNMTSIPSIIQILEDKGVNVK